jgi:hypothetical protein
MVKFIKIHVLLAKEIRVTQIRWRASGEIGSAPNASDSNIKVDDREDQKQGGESGENKGNPVSGKL